MGAYSRVTVDGHLLNRTTAELYNQVKAVYHVLGGTGYLILEQGSYNNTVGASAGTHNGGGALDVVPSIQTADNWNKLQMAFRYCMIAGWHRTTLYQSGRLVWRDHVHGIVIGDTDAAPLAMAQVVDYLSHPPRNGLAGHAVDNTWHPAVSFTPLYPLRSVTLKNMISEARKTRGRVPLPGVFRVQRALNKKIHAGLRVNGLFNAKTKAAFAEWERVCGGNGDGIPGRRSLTLLGAGRFNVV